MPTLAERRTSMYLVQITPRPPSAPMRATLRPPSAAGSCGGKTQVVLVPGETAAEALTAIRGYLDATQGPGDARPIEGTRCLARCGIAAPVGSRHG